MRRSDELENGPEQDEDDRMTRSLAGLAIALALVVAGLFLLQQLRSLSALQDCLMQGRNNCLQVESTR
jgi:hypothetical protein